jgi:hypothetical protein
LSSTHWQVNERAAAKYLRLRRFIRNRCDPDWHFQEKLIHPRRTFGALAAARGSSQKQGTRELPREFPVTSFNLLTHSLAVTAEGTVLGAVVASAEAGSPMVSALAMPELVSA